MIWHEVAIVIGVLATGTVAIYVLRSLARLQNSLRSLRGKVADVRDICQHSPTVYTDWIGALKLDKDLCFRLAGQCRKSLRFYEQLEAATLEEDLWHLARFKSSPLPFDIIPDEYMLPSKLVKDTLKLLELIQKKYHTQESALAGEQEAEDSEMVTVVGKE